MNNGNNSLQSGSPINGQPITLFDKFKKAGEGQNVRQLGQNNEPIKQMLAYAFSIVGLKPEYYPTRLDKLVLINFIKTHLSKFTVDEFKLAFDLLAAGDLCVDYKQYQQFSPLILGRVMSAFEKKSMEVRSNNLLEKVPPTKPVDESKKKMIELEFIRVIIIPAFNRYINTGINPLLPVQCEAVYKVLYNYGYGRINSQEELSDLKAQGEANYLKKEGIYQVRSLSEFKGLKMALEGNYKDQQIRRECYHLLVTRTFDELKEKKAIDGEILKHSKSNS